MPDTDYERHECPVHEDDGLRFICQDEPHSSGAVILLVGIFIGAVGALCFAALWDYLGKLLP